MWDLTYLIKNIFKNITVFNIIESKEKYLTLTNPKYWYNDSSGIGYIYSVDFLIKKY